jgi:hypothetical protein
MRHVLFALLVSVCAGPLLAQGAPPQGRPPTSPTQWSITTRCNGGISRNSCSSS